MAFGHGFPVSASIGSNASNARAVTTCTTSMLRTRRRPFERMH